MKYLKHFIIFLLCFIAEDAACSNIQSTFWGIILGQTSYSQAEVQLKNEGYELYYNAKEIQSDEMYHQGSLKKYYSLYRVIGIRNVIFGGEEWNEVNLFFVDNKFAYIIFYKEGNDKDFSHILDKMLSLDPHPYCPGTRYVWNNRIRYRVLDKYYAKKTSWNDNSKKWVQSSYELIMLEYYDEAIRKKVFHAAQKSANEF